MRLRPQGPACSCSCSEFFPRSTATSNVSSDLSRQVCQDISNQISFFRLSSEIRARIYFLSTRPDCQFSFGSDIPCEKRHVHQSTEGRRSAWKWLVLCRQTWEEAIVYMPIMRQEFSLIACADYCPRCGTGGRPLQEGLLHARIRPTIGGHRGLRELWLTRIQRFTLKIFRHRAADDNWKDRFVHNLRSIVTFVNKLKYLRRLELEISADLHFDPKMRELMQQLFIILFEMKVQIALTANDADDTEPTSSQSAVETLLEIAYTAGIRSDKIKVFPHIHSESIRSDPIQQVVPQSDFDNSLATDDTDFGASFVALKEVDADKAAKEMQRLKEDAKRKREDDEWYRRIGSSATWKTSLFDEDFASIRRSWSISDETETSFSWPLLGPTYSTLSGCCIYDKNKYQKLNNFMPLYFEDDFFLGSDIAQVRYEPLPECSMCGIVFAEYSHLELHDRACLRAAGAIGEELKMAGGKLDGLLTQ